jgi:hypothetical protein
LELELLSIPACSQIVTAGGAATRDRKQRGSYHKHAEANRACMKLKADATQVLVDLSKLLRLNKFNGHQREAGDNEPKTRQCGQNFQFFFPK